ncbi:MAG: hypothetical protein DI539_03150 [Flavobacterium psychrophilum]|nr:MAG: hypothetical protein DI539_03150 [Flavobacterium psychrophilum]
MKTFISILFIISTLVASAQEKTIAVESKKITGVIKDIEGIPVPGVTVIIEGSNEKAITDFDGNYTISAKEGEKLTVSFIGMLDETITIGKLSTIDFKLQEDPEFTKNMVFTSCYAPYIKTKLTSEPHAIKSVSALWEEKKPDKRFIKMLESKKTAISIGCTPDLSQTTVIRCYGSINGNPEPLYIIDGVPMNTDYIKKVNPDDIISINVLKDTNATSIYGNRGIDGVIIVKTKNGISKKEKRIQKREAKRLAKEQSKKS